MLEVTIIGSHSHGGIVKSLVKFATALFTCSRGSSSQMVYKATCLKALDGVNGNFPACFQDMIVHQEFEGPLILLGEPVCFDMKKQ